MGPKKRGGTYQTRTRRCIDDRPHKHHVIPMAKTTTGVGTAIAMVTGTIAQRLNTIPSRATAAKRTVPQEGNPTIGAENMMVAGTTAHQGAETENESKYKGWRVAACKKLSQT